MAGARAAGRWSPWTRAGAALLGLVRRRLWGTRTGPGTRIHPTAYIDRTHPRGLRIGAGCVIEREATILTHDFTRGVYLDTSIGDRTVIGPRAIVMPGVAVGADCIVMPGALVLRDLPDGHVAAGNPAVVTPRDQPLSARPPAGG